MSSRSSAAVRLEGPHQAPEAVVSRTPMQVVFDCLQGGCEASLVSNEVVDAAVRHGLAPRLYWVLRDAALPQPVRARLQQEFDMNMRHSMFLAAELLRVFELLQRNGIHAIPFKGPALSMMLYGTLALRDISDLDLMVRRSDFAGSKRLLLDDGYRPSFVLRPAEEASLLRHDCAITFEKDGWWLDLHWRITPAYCAVDFEPGTNPLMQVRIGNRDVPTFSPEDTLLLLAVHAAKHGWEKAAFIADVGALLRSGVDVDRALAMARSTGTERILLVAFALAERTLALPAAVRARIENDRRVGELARRISLMWDDPGAVPGMKRRWFIMARERGKDRFLFRARSLTSPGIADWHAVRLPEALAPLYPIVRIGRLAANTLFRHSDVVERRSAVNRLSDLPQQGEQSLRPHSPIMLDSYVAAVPDQLSCDTDIGAVVLHVQQGRYYDLNAVSARVWHLVQTRQRVRDLAEVLEKEYAVESRVCESDLIRALEKMAACGIVEVS